MENYEFSETGNTSELIEEGVLLEHFTFERAETDNAELEPLAEIFGTPENDVRFWEKADSECSDGIMCEKYVLKALSGNETIDILRESEVKGYFDPEFGSAPNDVGRCLEDAGFDVSREYGMTVKDLCEALDNDEKIICAVSSISVNFPEISDMPGLSADSYIEVIGMNKDAEDRKIVIANDPLALSGGTEIDLESFSAAWEKSGCYAVIVNKSRE